MANPFVLEYTLGVQLKSTTHIIQILFGFGVPSLGRSYILLLAIKFLKLVYLSSHLGDLKSLTEDVLYETYRTEKLSRSAHSDIRWVQCRLLNDVKLTLSISDSQILPSELATQSVRLKEEQLRREEEKVLMYLEARYVIAHTILISPFS